MENPASNIADGLLLSRDLMFTSKVTGTAEVLGFRVLCHGSLEGLAEAGSQVRTIFLDLSCPDFDPVQVVRLLPAPRPRLIAFGAHVETGLLQRARDAGCDEVFPRSRFSADLPNLLRQELG